MDMVFSALYRRGNQPRCVSGPPPITPLGKDLRLAGGRYFNDLGDPIAFVALLPESAKAPPGEERLDSGR